MMGNRTRGSRHVEPLRGGPCVEDGDAFEVYGLESLSGVAHDLEDRMFIESTFPVVGDIMSAGPICVAPETMTAKGEELAREHHIRHLPVTSAGKVLGVVCICDLWWMPPGTPIAQVMTHLPLTTEPGVSISRARDKMLLRNVGCLPVTRRGKIEGILTRGDLRRAGVGHPKLQRSCRVCGGRHHVRRVTCTDEPAFCLQCLAQRSPEDLEAALPG